MEKEDAKADAAKPDEDNKLVEKDRDFKHACRRYARMRARASR
jgi:hypothetical protein